MKNKLAKLLALLLAAAQLHASDGVHDRLHRKDRTARKSGGN